MKNSRVRKKSLLIILSLVMILATGVIANANWSPDNRYQNAPGEEYFIARKTQEAYDKLIEREASINSALGEIATVSISGTPLDVVITVEGYHPNRDFLEFVEALERAVAGVFKEATWVNIYNLEYEDLSQAIDLIKVFSEDKTFGTLKFKSHTGYAKFASNVVSYTIEYID